jgi:membrane protease YdiL (CAAX protease family)
MDEIEAVDVEHDEIEDAPLPDQPGLIRRIFRNRFSQWRAGWRMLVYLIAAFIVGKLISTPLKMLVPGVPESDFLSWTHTLIWLIGTLTLLIAGLLVLRIFDRRPPALLGLGFSRGWLREVALGLVGGLVATGLLVLILVATGSVSLALSANLRGSFGALGLFLVLFTLAAAVEELLFRGYFLQSLAEGSRRWIAGLLLCIPFTWAHADNPDVTIIGITNIFLAAVILVILYFQTRRLWLPIGFHISWNLAQSWLWGFDVSGIKISDQLFVMNPTGADYLTGGEFGLEGSALSTVLFVVLVVWLLWKKVLTPTDEVAEMWARYPAGFGMEPAVLPEPDAPPTIQTPGIESREAAEHS